VSILLGSGMRLRMDYDPCRCGSSLFLLSVLQYYQINFSQLSVLGAAKINHFEIMRRVLGHPPSLASVRKDPLLLDDVVDLDLLDKLDNNRTLIRKYPKTFLCLVGLSRSFDDPVACPTLLNRDKSDMGLLDFAKSVNPFKVNTDKRTLAEGDVPLLIETADMVVAPSA
ncbi:hypothetical protein Tco_1308233, partial [Tanacetum coccineum]